MATESFLPDFPPVTTEQWEDIIREKITGPNYASKLIWHPEEGLAVRPYYRADDLAGLHFLDAPPGQFPFVRGIRPHGDWLIREEIDVLDLEEANHAACAAVAAGAEQIAFRRPNLESASSLSLLLANLYEIPVHFEGLNRSSIELLTMRLKTHPHGAGVSADIDSLDDIEFSEDILRHALSDLRPFVICADNHHERGAGVIEEVGFTLSAAVEFVAEMQARGLNIARIATSVSFCFAMGPDFFLQIAKLRAFRMVWARAIESFGGNQTNSRAVIHARTAHWNATVYDPHINTLRATTEVMSAILGGANSISAEPFDECFRQPDANSRRLARNTQIVLKQEALLSRVADPVGGSYLIEVLTHSIAAKAWKLFQELETAGGYRKAKSAGVIASVLDRRFAAREQAFENRRCVLTGTNRFADTSEVALDILDKLRVDSNPRAAHAFESLRRNTEQFLRKGGKHPNILLAEIGDAPMSSARSQFGSDFLACAGLEAVKGRFESAEQIATSRADLIVLCSSDEEYLALATALMPILKQRQAHVRVIIAGNPDTADQLKSMGVIDFIHLRSNAVKVLAHIQLLIGMKE